MIKGPIHVDCLRADRATGYSQQSHKMAVLIVNKISSESYGHLLHCARIYRIDKHWSELLCADLTRLTQSNHCKTPPLAFTDDLNRLLCGLIELDNVNLITVSCEQMGKDA